MRPEGLGCIIRVWKPGMGVGTKTDLTFTLTEFADPNGKATYFRLRDFSPAVDDELLAARSP